jgi:hypothetical protein
MMRAMRFHTTHLIGLVFCVAIVLGVMRHPDVLRAAVPPLVGGVLVVLPVLGAYELTSPPAGSQPLRWRGVALLGAVAAVGIVACFVVGAWLVTFL